MWTQSILKPSQNASVLHILQLDKKLHKLKLALDFMQDVILPATQNETIYANLAWTEKLTKTAQSDTWLLKN